MVGAMMQTNLQTESTMEVLMQIHWHVSKNLEDTNLLRRGGNRLLRSDRIR